MNITIQVDEITLSTIVGDVIGIDEDGDTIVEGQRTVADLVAQQVMERVVRDDQYPNLRQRVTDIRDEEIREAVRPTIEAAITRPIHKTNGYGERTGEQTTLSELIAGEARKMLAEPVERYNPAKGTQLQQMIRDEVKRTFQQEIADTVAAARDAVMGELGADIARQVTAAVTAGLQKR
ncbi:hypothetical protein ACIQXD_04895 [Streptomyces uncialis]|uniref:hypothetical protein n=1 Tax=Streptomyces uncialis TaxID=1048205 RepID=UPI0037F5E928